MLPLLILILKNINAKSNFQLLVKKQPKAGWPRLLGMLHGRY